MSADQKLPLDQRRGYTSLFNLLLRVAREEGVTALWGGAAPTVARAALLNAGQLGVYSEAKERIAHRTGMTGLLLMFCSSLVSATAAVAMSSPADVLKSRMQVAHQCATIV
jgi:solute carrier family 25 oxoglutarate transporter 11